MAHEDAIRAGAMALFGEKYGDEVRVVGMGEFSTELCGGTHVRRTGDIGFFKIFSESGVASGIRRIEAVTAEGALEFVQNMDRQLTEAAELFRVPKWGGMIQLAIGNIIEEKRQLEKEIARMKSKLAASQGEDMASGAVDVNGVKVLAASMENADISMLRDTLDKLKDRLGSAVVVLASVQGGKAALIAGVTADLTARVRAGELVNFVASQVGGKGGGRPDMAQAGGTEPEKLPQALASVADWVQSRL
jgi:alanyl-tRNA synthetase